MYTYLPTFVLVFMAASALVAGESDVEDAVRALHREARSEGDLWTCLQLEGYVEQHLDMRINPAVRGCGVIGSPLLAYPEDVRDYWDRGDVVDVVAGHALFRSDGAGRPLQLVLQTGFDPHNTAQDHGGRHLSYGRVWGAYNRRRFSVAVQDTTTGAVTAQWVDQHLPPAPADVYDGIRGSVRCSWDGATVAFSVHRSGGPETKRAIVLVPDADRRTLRDAEAVYGVGEAGAWLLYRKSSDRDTCLREGNDECRVFSHARGPGLWVIETGQDEAFEFLTSSGERSPFAPSVAIGQNATVETCGDHLVVCSGHGAGGEPKLDMLGNVVEESSEQPHTLAIYRWADLAADRKAAPVLQLVQDFERADAHGPALLLIDGSRLEVLDLRGPEPVRSGLADLGANIEDVWNSHHYYLARLVGGGLVVVDASGRELWRGETGWATVRSRQHLEHWPEGHRQGPIKVVRLADDPEERAEITVDIAETDGWRIDCDRLGRRMVARKGRDWKRIEPATGKVLESYTYDDLNRRRAPRCDVNRNRGANRFYRRGGRLLDKRGSWREDPGRYALRPRNVIQSRSAFIILDHEDDIYIYRRGGFERLARGVHADAFGLLKGHRGLFLTNGRDRRIVAAIAGGPTVETDIPQAGEPAEDFDPGRWREQNLSYSVPGYVRLRWERDRYGYEPQLLASYHGSNLFMIFESVILEMTPAAARVVGTKDG